MESASVPFSESVFAQLRELVLKQKNSPGKKTKYPHELKELAVKALDSGLTIAALSKLCGAVPSTIYQWKQNLLKISTPGIPKAKICNVVTPSTDTEKSETFYEERAKLIVGSIQILISEKVKK